MGRRKKRLSQTGAKNSDAKKSVETCQTPTPESPLKKALPTTSPTPQTNKIKEEEVYTYNFNNREAIPNSPLKKKMKTPTAGGDLAAPVHEAPKPETEYDRMLLQ